LKIISWNCNMAFRKKWMLLSDSDADIIIIQEAEHDEKLEQALSDYNYNDIFWIGDNKHKGVAVITRNQYKIKLISKYSTDFKYIIPLKLEDNNSAIEINLFVIWAMPNKEHRSKSYVGQVWGAINYYEPLLRSESILIGDFNSNVFWDKERKYNHTSVVNFLQERNIVSLYHVQNQEQQGDEKEPTFYFYKKKEKPYHLDYCFLSDQLVSENTTLEIGKFEDWIKFSDHMPLFVNHININ